MSRDSEMSNNMSGKVWERWVRGVTYVLDTRDVQGLGWDSGSCEPCSSVILGFQLVLGTEGEAASHSIPSHPITHNPITPSPNHHPSTPALACFS